MNNTQKQIATFAGGCFWCTEAIFKDLNGVEKVVSGYTGGYKNNPKYEDVKSGNTGHAEAIQITFDPEEISFARLVEVFFLTHDPTSLNKQGHDIGTQYRSAIFYHNEEQKATALKVKVKFEEQKIYKFPLVTSIEPFQIFFLAEDYHQNYFEKNPNQPYCQMTINPKVSEFRKEFRALMKKK